MDKDTFLYLRTRGHISGKSHEIEIWFVQHGGCYYLVSEKREAAHWVRNIRAAPAVRFRLGKGWDASAATHAATARIVHDAELISAVAAKMQAKYGWSAGLVVEIRPVPA